MQYVLKREQLIPRPLEEVFDFFSRAENLEKLTPRWMNFRILNVDPSPVRKGTVIKYQLRWRVLPLRWTTEIIEWDPPHGFADVQLRGPYKVWHHEHRFVAEGGFTRMTDVVRYELPFGIFGTLAHAISVQRDVQRIFDFRRTAIDGLFPPA